MDTRRARCSARGCLEDATHDVYWDAGPRDHWATGDTARSYTRRLGLRPQWCRWHAMVEAVLRNAGSPEATKGTDG